MFDKSCVNNVSDEDCGKCMVRGLIFSCPQNCEDYDSGYGTKATLYMQDTATEEINNGRY